MANPTAQVQVSINGGAYTSGFVTAAFGQTVQLRQNPATGSGASTYTWELTDYPPALSLPSGWSNVNGVYTSYAATPPVITWPASASNAWGPLGVRLRLNSNPPQYNPDNSVAAAFQAQLTDETTVIDVPSPNAALYGMQFNAGFQYDARRGWVGQVMHDMRALDTAIGAASPGWQTALDFDFTAPSVHTFSSDGAFTFGGYAFTKAGTAAESGTHLTAGGGTGLVFSASSTGSSYNATTRTAPGIWLPLSQVTALSSMDWDTPLRIWLAVAALTATTGSDGLILTVDAQSVVLPTHNAKWSLTAGNNDFQLNSSVNSASALSCQAYAGAAWTAGYFMLDIPGGIAECRERIYAKQTLSSWPLLSAMQPTLDGAYSNTSSTGWASRIGSGIAPTGFGVGIFAPHNSGTTATVNRLRIDYRS